MQEIKSLLPIEDIPSIIVDKLASEHMRIQAYAKWLVAKELVPSVTLIQAKSATTAPTTNSFINALQRLDPHLTTADIEERALMLNVFDEIWPLNEYRKRLILPTNFKTRLQLNQKSSHAFVQ